MSLIGDLKHLVQNPAEINVVDSEDFHARICNVFGEVSEILQRSAGPCGAPAVISNMPSYHITKDGYTIAKSLMYDNYKGYLDQVVTYMITDICERLNNTVGDGTTAAILCTDAMYQAFTKKENKDKLNELFFLPRDILYRMKSLKGKIIDELMKSAKSIKDLPWEEMAEAIWEVVYISSNGNAETADMIRNIYKEIGSPAIRVETAKNGITRYSIIDGFEFKAQLTDKGYINSDEGVLVAENLRVLMFDFKVDMSTFDYVITPIVNEMRRKMPGERLLVLAPSFDTVALRNIAPSLNAELAATGMITMIMAVYQNSTADARRTADDFAMLTDMSIITEEKVDDIKKRQMIMRGELEMRRKSAQKSDVLDANSIDAEVLTKFAQYFLYKENRPEECPGVGQVGRAKIGRDISMFSGFSYNTHRYNAHLADATRNYHDALDQYRLTGEFTFDIDDCLARITRLQLKTAVIYIGSDTEFSTAFDKDAMNDAVRAAQSAYFNGTVIGKHVSMMRAIDTVWRATTDAKDELLLDILWDGFKHVNCAILKNGFVNDSLFETNTVKNISREDAAIYIKGRGVTIRFPHVPAFRSVYDSAVIVRSNSDTEEVADADRRPTTIFDFIIAYELATGTALDMSMVGENVLTFNTSVTNSAATDREILTAAIDLVGLLLTSNQLIIAKPNN